MLGTTTLKARYKAKKCDVVVGASLSEPHTSVTALRSVCVSIYSYGRTDHLPEILNLRIYEICTCRKFKICGFTKFVRAR